MKNVALAAPDRAPEEILESLASPSGAGRLKDPTECA